MKTFNPTTTVKTIASEQEAADYPQEEEEDILFSRFAWETDVEDWYAVFLLVLCRFLSLPMCPCILKINRMYARL